MHVEETDKGFFVSWIDNSPQALSKQASSQVKERQDMDDEQRQRKHIAEQIERARQLEEEKAAKQREEPVASGSGSGGEESGKSSGEERKPVGPISISIGFKKDSPPLVATVAVESEVIKVEEATTSTSTATPAITTAPIKINAFKKANPLKVNPLRAVKAPAVEKKTTSHSLTAVEQLMKEDQERQKRRRDNDSRERYGPDVKRMKAY